MIGIPLFAGFVTKFSLTRALLGCASWKLWVGILALVRSTVLNALYYIPVISLLFGRRGDNRFTGTEPHRDAACLVAIIVFIVLNFLLGTCSEPITRLIETGLSVLS